MAYNKALYTFICSTFLNCQYIKCEGASLIPVLHVSSLLQSQSGVAANCCAYDD